VELAVEMFVGSRGTAPVRDHQFQAFGSSELPRGIARFCLVLP
jgi:hypothetical protein